MGGERTLVTVLLEAGGDVVSVLEGGLSLLVLLAQHASHGFVT